jgi:hypothetical protein
VDGKLKQADELLGQRLPGRRARVQSAVRCTIAAITRTLPARKAAKMRQKVQRQWRDGDRGQGGECKGTVVKVISAPDRIVAAGSRRFHCRSSIVGRQSPRRSTDRRSRNSIRCRPWRRATSPREPVSSWPKATPVRGPATGAALAQQLGRGIELGIGVVPQYANCRTEQWCCGLGNYAGKPIPARPLCDIGCAAAWAHRGGWWPWAAEGVSPVHRPESRRHLLPWRHPKGG